MVGPKHALPAGNVSPTKDLCGGGGGAGANRSPLDMLHKMGPVVFLTGLSHVNRLDNRR